MQRKVFDDGVILDYDEHLFSVAASPAARRAARRRGGRGGAFDETPEPLSPPSTDDAAGAARSLADMLVRGGIVDQAGDTIDIGAGPAAPGAGRRARSPAAPNRLTVPLADGEQAVLLVEGDGVLAWRFGKPAALPAGARTRRGAAAATRALVFEIDVPPVAAPPGPGAVRRGWLRDKLVEGAKAIVLYFAADVAADAAVWLLERKRRNGPVVINSATDPGRWQKPTDFSRVALPADRPARVLLLVHGTFSSTLGGFGELTATPWGQKLLHAALERYDAVLGFDHKTLSVSPLENANDALAALRSLASTQPIEIDAICHSRGGLVLRTLIEKLMPQSGLPVTFRRAVFVAATNNGTELARPANWETLVDLMTNLSAVAAKVLSKFPTTAAASLVVEEVISCIGDFVKYLVQVAVEERQVPGIAAMEPDGDFVRDLNRTQPGQPGAGQIDCYAIVSDFHPRLFGDGEHEPREWPKRLAMLLADGVVDRLMRGEGAEPVPNDVVVDVASMTEIDQAVGGFVKDVLDFGANALVYHTVYFIRPETVGRLAQWLRLPSPLEGVDPLRLAGAQRRLLTVRADASVDETRRRLASEAPDYLVIARQDPAVDRRRLLRYAVRPEEFERFTRKARRDAAVIDAFDLHEGDSSESVDRSALPFERSAGPAPGPHVRPHARRSVVVDADAAQAVIDADQRAIDVFGLAELAHELTPRAAAVGGRRGRAGGAPDLAAPAPATPAKAELFVNGEMPREVQLGRQTFVTVTLSAEQIALAAGVAADQGRTTIDATKKLTVHVIPRRGFDYPGGDTSQAQAEVDAPARGEPVVLDFELVANEAGDGEVSVAVRQGPLRKLMLTLRSQVIDTTAAAPTAASRSSVSNGGAMVEVGECGKCATLTIFDRRNAGELQYEFILEAGNVYDRFRSDPLKVDPQAYVASRYDEIEQAWLGSQRAVDRFALRLEAIGGQMFRQLFPPQLQRTLWRLASSGALDGIQVHSDEPFLPWEVVFLDDPDAPASTGNGRFFGELGLCRWLYGAVPVCSISVRKGRAHYAIPHYPRADLRLPSAEDVEEPMLKKELGATAVEPRHDVLVQLLKGGGSFDLLHFACHGQADPQQIDSAALLLQGEIFQTPQGKTWGKESLLASTVDQFANLRGADGNRPLVVVNACQTGRLGYSLTGLGGFATAFLGTREGTGDSRGRAGAFVGALWSVGDEPASTFVTALYRALKNDETIAKASATARAASRGAGEGSWLAYAVYAHPHLKVSFG